MTTNWALSRQFIILMAFILAVTFQISVLDSPTELAASPGPGAPTTQPQTLFFDDFSEKELDRSKWNVEVTGMTVNNEQQAYVDSPDVLYIATGAEAAGAENGTALVVKGVYKPGFTTAQNRKYDFVSGRINTRGTFESANGTWAARIKLPAGPGLWPAFWALGTGRWPDTGEVDIMEYVGDTDWISAALHGPGYSGETPLVNKLMLRPEEAATGWHIYSVDWSPQEFLFKFDGHIYYRVSRAMVEHYGRWSYDNPKFIILNLALGGAYPLKINGVRTVPYPGIPEATVQLIKDGKAKMLVDWVRVTKG